MTNQLTHQERIQALTDKINELLDGQIIKRNLGLGNGTFTAFIMATDILRALGPLYSIDGFGEIYYQNNPHVWVSKLHKLNLSLPLHEQSEKVVSDLYKLFFE